MAAWERGEDPPFPGGENTEAVRKRVVSFLKDQQGQVGRTLVVTHNVVLRCLAGSLLGINSTDWYRLRIPHVTPLEVCVLNGQYYPNFAPDLKAAFTDAVLGWEREQTID